MKGELLRFTWGKDNLLKIVQASSVRIYPRQNSPTSTATWGHPTFMIGEQFQAMPAVRAS